MHVNTRFRAMEVGSLLRRARAGVLVTRWGFEPVDFPGLLASLPPEDRAGLRLVLGARLAAPTAVAGVPAHPLRPEGRVADAGREDAPCLTFTTSGTTSGPKLVLHTQGSIAGHALDVAAAMGLDRPGAALLAALPLCGTFGNAGAMGAVAGGAHIVCMDRFDPQEAAQLIRRHGVTNATFTDDMLDRVTQAAEGVPFTTPHRFGFGAFHSGAPAVAAAAEAIGLAPHGVYGSSEVQALFSVSHGANRHLGGGRPVSAKAIVSVRDPVSGAALAFGQSGELCFQAPSRFAGYLEDDAATARATTADGFFRSGDLGHLDGEGFVYEARLGDAMRLGGFLVNPDEIEGFLITLPGVAAAQVVAVDGVPVAFVVARPGARPDEAGLRARCQATMARYKVPARVAVVAAFPTTDSPNGLKVQRVRLREMAAALLKETAG